MGSTTSGPAADSPGVIASKEELQKLVDSHDLVIFSGPVGPAKLNLECPYTRKTLTKLDGAGITYHHHKVGPKGTDSRAALMSICQGVKTVPEGFCLGKYIGGYDESDGKHVGAPGIMTLLKNGKLKAH